MQVFSNARRKRLAHQSQTTHGLHRNLRAPVGSRVDDSYTVAVGSLNQPTPTSRHQRRCLSLCSFSSPTRRHLTLSYHLLLLQRQHSSVTTLVRRRTTFIHSPTTRCTVTPAAARLNTIQYAQHTQPSLTPCDTETPSRHTLFPGNAPQRPSRSPFAVQVTTTSNPSPFTGLVRIVHSCRQLPRAFASPSKAAATLLPPLFQPHTRSQCLQQPHGRCSLQRSLLPWLQHQSGLPLRSQTTPSPRRPT